MWLKFGRLNAPERMIMGNISWQRETEPIRYENMRVILPISGHRSRQDCRDAPGARAEVFVEPVHDQQKMPSFPGDTLRRTSPEIPEFSATFLRDCRLGRYLGQLSDDSPQEHFPVC